MQILTALVLTVLLPILWVIGDYEVEVRAHSYLNPTGRCDECRVDNNPDPGCCDESTIRPIDETCPVGGLVGCDTSIDICFRQINSTVELSCESPNTLIGTTFYFNTNSRNFSLGPSGFFGLANPLVHFSFGAWMGLQILYVVVDCNLAQSEDCNIVERIDAIPVDVDITVGTASPETTYIGLAGIAQFNVSFLVRCADGFYGQDCLTSCPNFGSCAGCGLSGFTGEFCQFSTEDCSEVFCNGNGDCVDGSSACDCNPGFTGDLCQVNIDDCEGVSCNNSGECIDQIDGFACECDLGFTGDFCQQNIDDCEDMNCNNGVCVDEVNSFTCQCNPGFFGEACENTDHCFGITCSGNGQCENLRNTFTCTCETGYTGIQCQVETIVDSAGASVGAIIGGVIGGVAVLAIIVAMVIILALSRARRSKGGNLEGKERNGMMSPMEDNPTYGTQVHAIDNPAYGPQVSATAHAQDSSVPERKFENPLYTSNKDAEDLYTIPSESPSPPNKDAEDPYTIPSESPSPPNKDAEDPYTIPSESLSPPNVYDRVGPRVLDEEEYYSAIAT